MAGMGRGPWERTVNGSAVIDWRLLGVRRRLRSADCNRCSLLLRRALLLQPWGANGWRELRNKRPSNRAHCRPTRNRPARMPHMAHRLHNIVMVQENSAC